jgi:hypothetical protein
MKIYTRRVESCDQCLFFEEGGSEDRTALEERCGNPASADKETGEKPLLRSINLDALYAACKRVGATPIPPWCKLDDAAKRGDAEQLRTFVRWLYREQDINLRLNDFNRSDLDEQVAVALVDRFLMSPEGLRQERDELDEIIQRGIEEMRTEGRYHG